MRGFEGFAQRIPRWKRGSAHTRISRTGLTLKHSRGRCLDGVIGSPAVLPGTIYRFAFIIGGTGGGQGAGVIVGVTDANLDVYATPGSPRDVGIWGVSLTHGVLYTKQGLEKGCLGSQTIITPVPDLGFFETLVIEVEVNLQTRRLAFGFRTNEGGAGNMPPLLETEVLLPNAPLRPWSYVWNEEDTVALLPRRLPRKSKIQQKGETPHLFEFSLGVYEERQKQSPREKPKSFSWDVVKYVTGFYKDIYRQI